jgi:CRISPR-associated protein Csx3
MRTFSVTQCPRRIAGIDAVLLRLGFAEQAANDVIVREVDTQMRKLKSEELRGGRLVLLDGPASLPVLAVIVHHIGHLFGAVAVFDPKLNGYVVAISHDPAFPVGAIVSDSDSKAVLDPNQEVPS